MYVGAHFKQQNVLIPMIKLPGNKTSSFSHPVLHICPSLYTEYLLVNKFDKKGPESATDSGRFN